MAEAYRIEHAAIPGEGHVTRVEVNGTPVAVFRVGGKLYGLDARCTHVGGPLDKGPIAGSHVTCPWHRSVFDVTDGHVVQGPANRPATPYRVVQEGTALVIERTDGL